MLLVFTVHCTTVLHSPKGNRNVAEKYEILRRIFRVASRFPLHFHIYIVHTISVNNCLVASKIKIVVIQNILS